MAAACAGGGSDDTTAKTGPSEYVTLDNRVASLAALQGKPTVVNFFASWCTPCLLEMPDFERLHQSLGDRVNFLGLNFEEDATQARKVIEQTKVTYPIALDPRVDLPAVQADQHAGNGNP